jgi:hypothetical protein
MTKCHPSDWLSVEVDLAPTAATSEIISRRLPPQTTRVRTLWQNCPNVPWAAIATAVELSGKFPLMSVR